MFDEKDCMPDLHRPSYPPEKPRLTMTEEVEHTAREMRDTIIRLQRFERRLQEQFEDMMKHITSDNVIFKDTFSQAHTLFLTEVKNEVNTFEGDMDSAFVLFKDDLESKYSDLSDECSAQITEYYNQMLQKIAELESSLVSVADNYNEARESRIGQYNDAMTETFNQYTIFMDERVSKMERQLEEDYSTFIAQSTQAMEGFRNSVNTMLSERLTTQDAKINDVVLYLKSNLTLAIENAVEEMKNDGELLSIIESEIFPDFETRLARIETAFVTPEMFGAKGNGVDDDSTAIANAIEHASTNGIGRVVFTGKYRVDTTIVLTNYRQDKVKKPVSLECRDGMQYTCCIIGNTGAEVFRLVNTHHMVCKVNIVSALYEHSMFVNPVPVSERVGSTIGYVVTREGNEASTHTAEFGGTIYLHHDMTANDGFGTIGLYNDTCEMANYKDIWYVADTPIMITTRDVLDITNNPYTASCKDHYFVGRNTLISRGNICLYIDGTTGVYGTVYGNCENAETESTFLCVPTFMQNFDLSIDTENTTFAINGKGCLSYGKLNLSSAGIEKGIVEMSLNGVEVYDNLYFKNDNSVVLEISEGENVMGCNIFTQYATPEKPRKIVNRSIIANTNIYPANSTTTGTVVVEKGEGSVMTLANIYHGNVDGYARNIDNRMVGWSYAQPTASVNTGSLFINRSDIMEVQDGHPAFWIKRGNTFHGFGQIGVRRVAEADLPNTTPRLVGEFVVDEHNKLHMATSMTAGAWTE